jgi:NAD(P)-dependent dehydrogenase (short-subunit alcohol dehydrogenase family)
MPDESAAPERTDYSGKVVVVTGAASGIGFGIAQAFAAAGAQVVVADIDEAAATDAASRLSGLPGLPVRTDVTERSDVERLADVAWERFGHVDIIVNNAGVFPGRMSDLVHASEADARWVLEVNVFGVWHGISVFGERFIQQGTPAHIVNTGSENSVGMPHTHAGFYTASKHAVLALSDVLRNELPEFIKVSILCPGYVPSELQRAARNRPDRFGGKVDARRSDTPTDVGMPPSEVGQRVVAGVAAGDFTSSPIHPSVRSWTRDMRKWLQRSKLALPGSTATNTSTRVGSRAGRADESNSLTIDLDGERHMRWRNPQTPAARTW